MVNIRIVFKDGTTEQVNNVDSIVFTNTMLVIWIIPYTDTDSMLVVHNHYKRKLIEKIIPY